MRNVCHLLGVDSKTARRFQIVGLYFLKQLGAHKRFKTKETKSMLVTKECKIAFHEDQNLLCKVEILNWVSSLKSCQCTSLNKESAFYQEIAGSFALIICYVKVRMKESAKVTFSLNKSSV